MRAFRICGSLWLLGALLIAIGCGSANTYVKKGPEKKTDTVTINNCKADPDTVRVPKGSTLTWINDPLESPTHTYTIKFHGKKPIASDTAPTGQGQTITGDFACSALGWVSSSHCMYAYDLIQDGSTKCPDPGVHVGSGGP
jgi:plastocyanin